MSGVLNDKGIFSKAELATGKYNEAKAREALETVLIGVAQYEKRTNPKYNQDNFLDEIIRKEVERGDAKGDVAIAGDYAFALDRSVPRLGEYLGNPKDLVWPTVTVSEPVLADNFRTASFTATASETENGISKIEVWLNGQRIDSLTKEYSNVTTEIKETYTVNKNGVYTVKAYSKLSGYATTEVTGIVPAVEFSPDGSTEWKKEHSTKITVKETGETITGMKYLWTDSGSNEPKPEQFTESCANNSTITGGNDKMTGTYYLWVLLTLEGNKTSVCGSKGFNFDNEVPTVTLESTPISETSFTLTTTANDNHSGIAKYEFYVDGTQVDTRTTSEGTVTYTWNGTEMAKNKQCYIIVFDNAKNSTKKQISANTKLHTWEMWDGKAIYTYYMTESYKGIHLDLESNKTYSGYSSCTYNPSSRTFTLSNYIGTDMFRHTPWIKEWYYQDKYGKYWHNISPSLTDFNANGGWRSYLLGDSSTFDHFEKSDVFRGTTTSINENEYPKNDYSKKYWYIYVGIK